MYISNLFQRLSNGASANYYSPTFPRGGLAETFGIEVFNLFGTSPTLECTVEHKNVEDTSFMSAGSFTSITAAGVQKHDVSSLKEQIRLLLNVGGTAGTNTVYANVLAPMWRPY